MGMQSIIVIMENVGRLIKILKIILSHDSEISLLGIYLKEIKSNKIR